MVKSQERDDFPLKQKSKNVTPPVHCKNEGWDFGLPVTQNPVTQ